MEKVKIRLDKMKIEVGEMIGESTTMMCYHKSTNWNGVIKVHLKNSKKDGTTLLQGFRAFILILDKNVVRGGKVCKSFDVLVSNNLLSVKIVSKKLKENEWFRVYEDIVIEGFKRGHEYELQMSKKKENSTLHRL